MNDPRKGRPSASGVERLALCPGSWNLESKLPPAPESEDAAAGTRIHAALAGDADAFNSLSRNELETYGMCRELRKSTQDMVLGDRVDSVSMEQRLWLGDSFSGQYDFLAIGGNKALVLDFKTGRGEVESAEGNLQLRALVSLVFENHHGLSEIVVGIIQPWASPQVSLCRYDRAAIMMANSELVKILEEANHPKAPRIPSEKACKYCRGKLQCKELLDYLLAFHKDLECAKRNQHSPQAELV